MIVLVRTTQPGTRSHVPVGVLPLPAHIMSASLTLSSTPSFQLVQHAVLQTGLCYSSHQTFRDIPPRHARWYAASNTFVVTVAKYKIRYECRSGTKVRCSLPKYSLNATHISPLDSLQPSRIPVCPSQRSQIPSIQFKHQGGIG